MGAFIRILSNDLLTDNELQDVGDTLCKITSEALDDSDVFLIVEQPQLSMNLNAVEIFIQVNSEKVKNPKRLITEIANKLSARKNTKTLININLFPVDWHSKIGI